MVSDRETWGVLQKEGRGELYAGHVALQVISLRGDSTIPMTTVCSELYGVERKTYSHYRTASLCFRHKACSIGRKKLEYSSAALKDHSLIINSVKITVPVSSGTLWCVLDT